MCPPAAGKSTRTCWCCINSWARSGGGVCSRFAAGCVSLSPGSSIGGQQRQQQPAGPGSVGAPQPCSSAAAHTAAGEGGKAAVVGSAAAASLQPPCSISFSDCCCWCCWRRRQCAWWRQVQCWRVREAAGALLAGLADGAWAGAAHTSTSTSVSSNCHCCCCCSRQAVHGCRHRQHDHQQQQHGFCRSQPGTGSVRSAADAADRGRGPRGTAGTCWCYHQQRLLLHSARPGPLTAAAAVLQAPGAVEGVCCC